MDQKIINDFLATTNINDFGNIMRINNIKTKDLPKETIEHHKKISKPSGNFNCPDEDICLDVLIEN